jgi:hypothetical protein
LCFCVKAAVLRVRLRLILLVVVVVWFDICGVVCPVSRRWSQFVGGFEVLIGGIVCIFSFFLCFCAPFCFSWMNSNIVP